MRHSVFAAALSVVCLAAAPAAAQPLLTHEGDAYTLRATRITRRWASTAGSMSRSTSRFPRSPSSSSRSRRRARRSRNAPKRGCCSTTTNIYFACRCWDTHPERIVANDMRRDSSNLRQNDNFGVVLDTFHDRRNGFLFYVTPVGGMFDGATTDERINNADWNTVWQAKASRFDGGWIAEIAIPFKSLRYGPGREQTWGINLRRTIRGKNEYAYITPMQAPWGVGALFRTSAAATLVGLEVPPPAKNLEIKPYAISRLTTDLVATPAVHNDFDPDVGLDVKYGVTKGLTADFTYNTDFAQVEADEVQVNLTRFNLLFPEKRDFFLEGQGTFTFGGVGGGGPPLPGRTAPAAARATRRRSSTAAGSASRTGAPVPIIGGGRLSRAGGAVDHRRAQHLQRRRSGCAGGADQLHRAAAAARRAAAQHHRRAVHRRGRSRPSRRDRNQLAGVDGKFAFYQNVYFSGYVGEDADRRPRGRRLQLPRPVQLRGRPIRLPGRSPGRAGRTSTPRSGSCRGRTSGATSSRPGSARGRRRTRRFGSTTSTAASTTPPTTTIAWSRGGDGRASASSCRTATRSTSSTCATTSCCAGRSSWRRACASRSAVTPSSTCAAPSLGQQHPLSGTAAVEVGGFYDGTKRTAAMHGALGVTRSSASSRTSRSTGSTARRRATSSRPPARAPPSR